jgi:prepilin-type N-terminal cleavage/methylation domain-containing protein
VRTIASQTRARRAFSLVELLAVIIIMGITAAVAAPAFVAMRDATRQALAGEVERMLMVARARAMTQGKPHGVRIETATLTPLHINTLGAAPTAPTGVDGMPMPPVVIAEEFRGASLTSLVAGDGVATLSSGFTVWFGKDGTPQLRQSSGTLIGPWSQDMVVSVLGGATVSVHSGTGAITR